MSLTLIIFVGNNINHIEQNVRARFVRSSVYVLGIVGDGRKETQYDITLYVLSSSCNSLLVLHMRGNADILWDRSEQVGMDEHVFLFQKIINYCGMGGWTIVIKLSFN